MNYFASIEGKITKLWFSQNWDKFFYLFFFHWFCSISIYISSNFLATLRLIIIMFRPLVINDQKILLTLCTKFETLVAPSKLCSKLLKFCMRYFITKINKMGDEEVKNLKLHFSWITLFFMVWFVLGHSGQRTSVKCAEAAWNYKAGGIVHLRGYCTPGQFLDCFCIFLKNYNTLVTSKICFL